MTALAPVDELRALPPPLALAVLQRLEREHGPEAVAALRYCREFWLRPAQRVDDLDDLATIEVFVGERRTGKTFAARDLFSRLVRTGRAKIPRIVSATDAAIEEIVIDGESGMKKWIDPGEWKESCGFLKSSGFAGTLHLFGTKIICCSAGAPAQAIGTSRDCTLVEDPAGWVASVGEARAAETWDQVLTSNSEGICTIIVATTREGAEFILDLLDVSVRNDPGFVRIHDLGTVENNRGNLAPKYVTRIVADLKRRAVWDKNSNASPFAAFEFSKIREALAPRLKVIAVAIDPSRSAGKGSCEVGIAGGGLDAKDVVHVTHDRSAVLDSGVHGWPSVAWDLAEELQRENPGAEFRFVLETNVGDTLAELLRAEERARLKDRGLPGINSVEIVRVRAGKDKCARAKLPARIASQGVVKIAEGLGAAESQLRNLTPEGKKSDRADAIVHLVRDLAGLSDEKELERGREDAEAAEEMRRQIQLAAAINASNAARRGGADPAGEPQIMKVEGAPPGDSRYAGPPPRPAFARVNWRSRGVL